MDVEVEKKRPWALRDAWQWVDRKFLTPEVSPSAGLEYWRDRIFRTVSLVGLATGLVVTVLGVANLFSEGRPLLGMFSVVVFTILAVVLLGRPFGKTPTAVFALTCLFLLGALHLITRGTSSGGLAYLFGIPILSGILLGMASTIYALCLSAVVYVALGVMLSQGMLDWALVSGLTLGKWVSSALNFLYVNTLVAISCTYLVNGIQSANQQQKEAMASLEREMNERLRAEKAATEALGQKEVLLREVHHRVKNNLQMVNSLMRLQSEASDDPKLEQILAECRARVMAMSMVHESLLRDTDQETVDLSTYVSGLAGELMQSVSTKARNVRFEVDTNGLKLEMDQAVTCGLIINELFTNTVKHAFEGRGSGMVLVRTRLLEDGQVELVVSDDGAGPPPDFDPRRLGGLGIQLVIGLVENQLNGHWRLDPPPGMRWVIRWPRRETQPPASPP